MIKVVLDATLRDKLDRLTQPADLCDETGRVLGRFLPSPERAGYEPLEPQISEEELQRRSRSDEKTYTTAEVLAHLEKL